MIQFLTLLVALITTVSVAYILWRPHWMFVVVIALFPLEQLLTVYLPQLGARSWLFNVIVGSLAVFAVATRALRREPMTSGYLNGVTVLVWALYVLFAVGVVYTPAKEEARMRLVGGLPYFGLLLLLLPLLIVDIREFQRMVTGLMVLGTAIAVLIIVNPNSSYHGGRLMLDLGMTGGGPHDRGNPLALAELGGGMALAAALIRPPWPNPLFNALRIAAFIAGFGLAIGSGSRGQVLAAGITGVLFFPLARRLANPKQFIINSIGFGVLLGGIYLVFKLFIGQQNRERWDVWQMMQDILLRLDLVWELLAAWLASPAHWMFGLGTQAFAAITTRHHEVYVHNIAAEILCQHGIVGFVIFLSFTWLTFKYGYQLWTIYKDDPTMRATVATLSAICFYGLVLALKQGSIYHPTPFFWWIVLAKLSLHEQRELAWNRAVIVEDLPEDSQAGDDGMVDPDLAVAYGRPS